LRGQKLAGALASAVLAAAVGIGPITGALQTAAPATAEPLVTLEPKLAAELSEVDAGAKVEVLVGATSAAAAEQAIRNVGLKPFLTFDKVGFSSTSGSADAIRRLAEQPEVTYVQGNRALKPTMSTAPMATRIPEAEAAYAEAQTNGGKLPDQATRGQGNKTGHAKADPPAAGEAGALDGSGVGIAVVDSGMAGDHEMFTDASGKTRLLNIKQMCVNLFACDTQAGDEPDEYFINATGLDTDLMATGGHGTHVTSIAGGKDVTTSTGEALRGVARNSSLYGIGAGLGIFVLNAANSLNWVLEHHAAPCAPFALPPADVAGGCAPIKVVNNSYGSPGEYNANDFFAVISEALVAEGVTVVWAAGNGDDITETNPRPNDGSVNLSNPPGQSPVPGVLMVANYDDGGIGHRDGLLNPSSSRGRYGRPTTYPDVAAPGTNILAACRPWLPICSSGEDPNYGSISGTSMAAPHVAGVVALLLQANPSLTPADIEDVLEDTAYQFTAGGPYEADPRNADHTTSFDKGHGLVDVYAALSEVMGSPITQDAPADVEICSASRVFLDTAGDATAEMDLIEGQMAWDGSVLSTTVSLTEVGASYPDGTTGRSFFVDFNIAGVPYFITAGDSLSELNEFGSAMGRPEGNIRSQKVSDGMTATLDPEAKTVTITMTQATFDALNTELGTEDGFKPLPALASTTFNNIASVTYTETGFLVSALTEHDVASSGCGFTTGSGAISEPPPPRYEEPTGETGGGITAPTDGEVTLASGQTHTFEGTPEKNFVEKECAGVMDEECFVYAVDVSAGTLAIELYAFEGADYDLFVYDSAGNEVELGDTLPTHNFVGTVFEGGTVAAAAPGRYFVVVQPFLTTPNFPFELVVTLE
jgi:subtilisin family serine protease